MERHRKLRAGKGFETLGALRGSEGPCASEKRRGPSGVSLQSDGQRDVRAGRGRRSHGGERPCGRALPWGEDGASGRRHQRYLFLTE